MILYGRETGHLRLTEEHLLKLKTECLWRMLGSLTDEVIGAGKFK
jgi:hypothetical protein